MTQDAKVQIGLSSDFLEGTKVTTPAGDDLFREGVVISDPEIPGARAEVRQMGTELTTGDWGLVTHSVIQGFSTGGGGQYHDVKVTPSGALTVEADVTGTVALDAATLAALESVNATVSGSVSVNNFPVTQQVSGTVALDSATLAALETINVGNFPATQAVSATDLDIRNLSSAQDSVSITDGGGSITVDGSVSVSGTVAVSNFPATQAVSGTVEITNDAGNPIPVSGSVNATVTATDLDIRNLSSAQDSVTVTGSVNVGNFPATQAVSATDLDIRNLSSVQDNVRAFDSTDSEYLRIATSVTATGDTTLVTPAAGKRIRLQWVYAINDPTAVLSTKITIKLGAAVQYVAWAISKRQQLTGAVDAPLVINLSNLGDVAVTVFYQEV